ncbi:hypothetical protein B0T10DRAFT_484249, partial [Thelonectria olida]
ANHGVVRRRLAPAPLIVSCLSFLFSHPPFSLTCLLLSFSLVCFSFLDPIPIPSVLPPSILIHPQSVIHIHPSPLADDHPPAPKDRGRVFNSRLIIKFPIARIMPGPPLPQ